MSAIGQTAIKPVERHGCEAIRYFLHNPETGEIMGRTPLSWLKIFVFYVIYYAFLTAFWLACMYVFLTTLHDRIPKWTQDGSLIGRSGALGVRPTQTYELIDSAMIMFNAEAEKDGKHVPGWGGWVERSKEFLEKYQNQDDGVDCAGGATPKPGQYCRFDLSQLGPCGDVNSNLGYDQGKPCVYLKLNKIFGVEPEYYNTVDNLPSGFPSRIEKMIAEKKAGDVDRIWVDCHGENPADDEGSGTINYYPRESGLAAYYYPYTNQEGYRSPLLAVQFDKPVFGQLIHVECRAWAGNIGYDRRDKLGKAHFELMIHDTDTARMVDKEL